MFKSDNCKLFHLLWKENLVKHQKVSKYYENDCRTIDDFAISNYFSSYRVFIFYFSDNDINNVTFKWTQKKLFGKGEFADVSFVL